MSEYFCLYISLNTNTNYPFSLLVSVFLTRSSRFQSQIYAHLAFSFRIACTLNCTNSVLVKDNTARIYRNRQRHRFLPFIVARY